LRHITSHAEWTETSRLLFAGNGAHRQLGVDRVQAWRARGRIPVAVDATAALLEVGSVGNGWRLMVMRALCSIHVVRHTTTHMYL
jgi:hypothetical protein